MWEKASSWLQEDKSGEVDTTKIEDEDDTEEVDEGNDDENPEIQVVGISSYCSSNDVGFCAPYKIETLDQQLLNNSPGAGRRTAIIETLRQMGVIVFVLDSSNIQSNEDVVQHIRRVVGFVARENCVLPRNGPLGFQRCLFYLDQQGRLFNLVLSKHVTGPSGTWMEYLESFSGTEAMVALTVLCRSLPCAANGKKSIQQVKKRLTQLHI